MKELGMNAGCSMGRSPSPIQAQPPILSQPALVTFPDPPQTSMKWKRCARGLSGSGKGPFQSSMSNSCSCLSTSNFRTRLPCYATTWHRRFSSFQYPKGREQHSWSLGRKQMHPLPQMRQRRRWHYPWPQQGRRPWKAPTPQASQTLGQRPCSGCTTWDHLYKPHPWGQACTPRRAKTWTACDTSWHESMHQVNRHEGHPKSIEVMPAQGRRATEPGASWQVRTAKPNPACVLQSLSPGLHPTHPCQPSPRCRLLHKPRLHETSACKPQRKTQQLRRLEAPLHWASQQRPRNSHQ